MNKFSRNTVVAMIAFSLFFSGCATQQGNDQLKGMGAGAAGGALLGCLIGLAVAGGKGCASGAIIGGATGAVAGWGAVKVSQYQATKIRDAQDDRRLYGLTKPIDSVQVKIRKGTSTPNTVRPGEPVKITTDYSVMLPRNQRNILVTESWALKRDNELLLNIPGRDNLRESGGWAADGMFSVPNNAKPGTYVVEHKVAAGTSYDTDESVFVVQR